jgi:hypothetical protein
LSAVTVKVSLNVDEPIAGISIPTKVGIRPGTASNDANGFSEHAPASERHN